MIDMDITNFNKENIQFYTETLWDKIKSRQGLGYYDGTPVGTVISYMGKIPPEGYLACDGKVYNLSLYPELANHIKDNFGKVNFFGGDGVNTFATPDLNGNGINGINTKNENTKHVFLDQNYLNTILYCIKCYTALKSSLKTIKSLTDFVLIPENSDLKSESYIIPGNYCCDSAEKAITLKNCPVVIPFTMNVSYATGKSDYIMQEISNYTGKAIIKRNLNIATSTWGPDYRYQGN